MGLVHRLRAWFGRTAVSRQNDSTVEQPPTWDTFHERLVAQCFDRSISDTDAFLLFVLLHTYAIWVAPGVLPDWPAGVGYHGLTWHGAADCLAELWRGTADERSDDVYWYYRWMEVWGDYGHANNLSPDEMRRLSELKDVLLAHPWVADVEDDED